MAQAARATAFFDVKPLPLPHLPASEAKIVDAARRCLIQYGSQKVSMNDVAREAGVSRGTVYNYMSDKEALVHSVFDLLCDWIIEDVSDAMATREWFEDQAVEAAKVIDHWSKRALRSQWLTASEKALSLTSDTVRTVPPLVDAIAKFVEAAKDRGELRQDLDIHAGAEWVTRAILSFMLMPPLTFRGDGTDELEQFIRSYIVRGLD